MKATRRRSVNIGDDRRRPRPVLHVGRLRSALLGPGPPPCRSPLPVPRPLTAERITPVFTPRQSRRDTSSSVVRCTVASPAGPVRSGPARTNPPGGRRATCNPGRRGIDQRRWQSLTRGDEPISGGHRPLPDEP